MPESDDYARENRSRIIALEGAVTEVRMGQATIEARLEAGEKRADERHDDLKSATASIEASVVSELRAMRDQQSDVQVAQAQASAGWAETLRDPRVLIIGAIVILAALGQNVAPLLGQAVGAVLQPPAAETPSVEP